MLSAFILSVHSYSALHLAAQQIHQRYVRPGPLVLRSCPLNFLAPITDRDRTVLRRSEPSSRATLIGEQPNPWDLLQPQDVTNRHRGAKPPRRYELLGEISLLSPAYLLSVERWPFHTEPPDHFDLLSHLLDLSVSQSSTLLPMHIEARFPTALSVPSYSSVTLWEETAPVKLPTMHGPRPGSRAKVRAANKSGWYFKVGSTMASATASKPPSYPTQTGSQSNAKL